MRRSTIFFIFIAINLMVLVAFYAGSRISIVRHAADIKDLNGIVKALHLTDPVLSTDARYTRNPTQADLFSAFQDSPGSLEHFPTGSVIPPPEFKSVSAVSVTGEDPGSPDAHRRLP